MTRRPSWRELGWRGVLRWYDLDDPLHWLLSLRCGLLGHRWGEVKTNSKGHAHRRCRWYGMHNEMVCDCHRLALGWYWWRGLRVCWLLGHQWRGPVPLAEPRGRLIPWSWWCHRCGTHRPGPSLPVS